MPMQYFAETALLPDGWADRVAVTIGPDGRIAEVTRDTDGAGADMRVGILLPAPVNAHSHAFQRAMAGLTERRGPDASDSFWTWRELMYRFLDRLTPEDIEAVTAFVQMEMLEAGYAASVEFHYLHHQPGGAPYDDQAELSLRCISATGVSGIGFTLLPVFYQYGGCDRRPLGGGQIRFGNDLDRFTRLHANAQSALGALPDDARIGVAAHSLRAVAPEDLAHLPALAQGGPIHMHLAEQVAEVEEVTAHTGSRPVEWVLDNVPVDGRWCMIHCTQMLPHETAGLAEAGAVAGLCPITESSLGDGIFDGIDWLSHGGRIAVGSDSNIRISLSEELRTLEYSQRLRDRSRAALATPDRSTGRRLFDGCLEGGALAAGRDSGGIEVGKWADLSVLDPTHPDLEGRTGDTILDTFIFAGDDRMVTDVLSAGRHLVQGGRHVARDAITQNYRRAVARLRVAI